MRPLSVALILGFFPLLAGADDILTFPAADLVLGQPNFTSSAETNPPTSSSLADAGDVFRDPFSGKVFVADTENNRVLRYRNPATLVNGGPAEYAFGQANLTSKASGTSISLNSGPAGLALDSADRLWVADPDNNRVLRFDNAVSTTTSLPSAALVLGQPGFTTATVPAAPTAASMKGPFGVHLDSDGRLWVADSGNHRVLRFDNAAALTNGASANAVLGQNSFIVSGSGNTAASFNTPFDVTLDPSGTLWVADRGNHRILGFSSAASLANGIPATRVLGQSDFTTFSSGLSASRLNAPNGVFADGNALWVLDAGNSRALRFSPLASLANGAAATIVVGQPNFSTAADIIDARHFFSPFMGLFVDVDGALWVSDQNRRRVLRFDPEISARPRISIRGRSRITTAKRTLKIRGSASADTSVVSILVANGKDRRPVLGIERWSSRVRLKGKKNVIKATAVDALGKSSKPDRLVVFKR